MSSRDFNEELGYSVINPGTVVGTEFAPPRGSVWWGGRAGGPSPAQIRAMVRLVD